LNGRTDHIAERHEANWHGDWDRRHAHFDHDRFFVFEDGFWFGLDPGFFPWDYLPYYAADYYPYDYYADVQPNDYTVGSVDNSVPVADPTVQTVQTELTQLGYFRSDDARRAGEISNRKTPERNRKSFTRHPAIAWIAAGNAELNDNTGSR
jgi:hypothetical protein